MKKGNKNKKKDVDFQKVKLKVGRKLKRDSNETRAEFKSKKIVIKEAKFYKTDPLSMLLTHGSNCSQHSKLNLLNQLSSVINSDIIKSLNRPFIDSLGKFIIDQSDQVRLAAIRCLKTCMNQMRQQHASLTDFVECLKPYIVCAYTHLDQGIYKSCRKLLDCLIRFNDPDIHLILMAILIERLGMDGVESVDCQLASQLKNNRVKYLAKREKEAMINKDKVKPLVWTEVNFYLDLNNLKCVYNNSNKEDIIQGLQHNDKDDIEDKFIKILDLTIIKFT